MVKVGTSESLKVLFPEELEDFIRSHKEGTYTLLDVRQESEYEEAHLPGARLVPLPLLADALGELEPENPMIVYCAVGGRSRMAAQFLMNHGFKDVYNLQGGIQSWEQPAATGPVELHLRFVKGDEGPREVVAIAYRMEEGLKQFHLRMKENSSDAALIELLSHLVRAEESHRRSLLQLLEQATGDTGLTDEVEGTGLEKTSAELMEGGLDIETFWEQNRPYLTTVAGYLDIAMMIEIQALDLYLRMANESRDVRTRDVLRRIGDEEKAHLSALGRFIDENPRSSLQRPIGTDD
jgi:sulfur-carrier protein adenylyltransferase/sulfurtransferase